MARLEAGIEHQLSEWFQPDDSCEFWRACSRCPLAERGDTKHDFSEWSYSGAEHLNEQVRTCERCGEKEKRPVSFLFNKHSPIRPPLVDEPTLRIQSSSYMSNLANQPDEEIVKLCKNGDEFATEYLISKYKNFVRVKAKSYFLVGASEEDIIQEGMIGLYKAIRDYRADKLSSFRAFAELCITRQIITAIKTATREKHIPTSSYMTLDKPVYDEESDATMLEILIGISSSSIAEEEFEPEEDDDPSDDDLESIYASLSYLEREVWFGHLEGKPHRQMAEELNRHMKAIDNALQRARRKVRSILS